MGTQETDHFQTDGIRTVRDHTLQEDRIADQDRSPELAITTRDALTPPKEKTKRVAIAVGT